MLLHTLVSPLSMSLVIVWAAMGKSQQLKTNNGPAYTLLIFRGSVRTIRYMSPVVFLIILKGRP
jgi:hypothetical protein